MIESEKYIIVHACSIDNYHIKYKCIFCNKIHKHGSGGDFSNRYEIRTSHCKINHKNEVKIIIDNNTQRFNK